jgi:UDP-GlcNAc:undecaprenyl-phosphate/decaprenyl-phosphate GlcNAc-1-phosphate transferase
MFKYAVIFLVSLVSALVCTPVVGRYAIGMGVMDLPGERRIHSVPVPRLGGIAVFLALVVTFSLCAIGDRYFHNIFFGHSLHLAILIGVSGIVVLIGGLDDVFSLSPGLKLGGQMLAASILMLAGAGISIIGGVRLGIWGLPLTLLWLLAVTNAFNLIDGLDGLAAGIGAIVSATLFANFVCLGDAANAMLVAALGGALLGFLRYNFHPAQIFLGDAGALLIGFILAAVSMDTGNRPPAIVAILTPILALGMPLAETALTVIRRSLRTVRVVGYNPQTGRYEFLFVAKAALFTADRQHIHHRLLDFGLSHRNAVLVLYAISLALGIGALGIVIYRQMNLALLLTAFGLVSLVGIRRLNYGELHLIQKGVLLPLLDSALTSRKKLQMMADLGFIIVSYCAAVLIAAGGMVSVVKASFLRAVPLFAVTQIAALAFSGLYRRSYRNGGIGDLLASFKSVMIAVAASWLVALLLRGRADFSLNVAMLDTYLLVTMVIGGRLSFRALEYVFKSQRGGHKRALIYGIEDAAMSALHEIRNNPALDLQVVGFVHDSAKAGSRTLDGIPILDLRCLERLIKNHQIDEIVLAETRLPEGYLEHVREACGNSGITIRRFSVDWHEISTRPAYFANAKAAIG